MIPTSMHLNFQILKLHTAAAKPKKDNLETAFLKVLIHGSVFNDKSFLLRVEPGLTWQVPT